MLRRMENIVLLDAATLPVTLPRAAFPHVWTSHDYSTEAEVADRLADATIVISNKVEVRRSTLERCPKLKMVAVAATGVDHVDVEACRDLGIAVANARSYGSGSVAEHALSLLFALRRNLVAHDRAVRDGEWSRASAFFLQVAPISDLAGSTLGLVGYGSIGRTMATLARALGMEVLVAERGGQRPRPGRLPFEEVLERCDALSLHAPLNADTRHLIDAGALARLKPHAMLVNTARGGLIDPQALVDALRAGRLAGAGLDALDTEPPPADDPLLALHREGTTNLLITPHVAWASRNAVEALARQVVENMEAFVAGEALRRVV